MNLAVDQVLAERERLARSGLAAASLIGAAGLHAAIAALLVLLPRLVPAPPPLEYVAVQVVPAQRLGAERTAAPARQEKPKPEPPPPKEEPPLPPRSAEAPVLPRPEPPKRAPKPVKPEKPKPEPPDNRIDPTTQPKFLPPPREVLAKKLAASPPPPQPAAPPGAAKGSAAGTVAAGALTVTAVNQNFPYNYYFAQIQSRIEDAWTRSPVGNDAHAVISFTIHADGSISDLRVRESSGSDTFDLGALRAVQNAAPFAPLPRAYTISQTSLEVNWKVW
jgi:periplasmic protein TonB